MSSDILRRKHLIGLYVAWVIAATVLAIAVARPAAIRPTYTPRYHHHYQSGASTGYRSHTSDFYTVLRWVCCAAFTYSAVTALQTKRVPWTWIFGILAVLFNPIAPVYLQRETWLVIDCAAIGLIVIAGVVFWRTNKQA